MDTIWKYWKRREKCFYDDSKRLKYDNVGKGALNDRGKEVNQEEIKMKIQFKLTLSTWIKTSVGVWCQAVYSQLI